MLKINLASGFLRPYSRAYRRGPRLVSLSASRSLVFFESFACRASHIVYRASRIAHRALCVVHRASCIVHRASCIAHRASRIVYRVTCIAHPASCVVYRTSCAGHRVSCIAHRVARVALISCKQHKYLGIGSDYVLIIIMFCYGGVSNFVRTVSSEG